MKKNIQDLLIPVIKKSIESLVPAEGATPEIILDFPTDAHFGELSTNIALKLAKGLKKPPVEIAKILINNIKSGLEEGNLIQYVREIKVEGAGFINFYFSNVFFHDYLQDILKEKEKSFQPDFGSGKRVLIEFVSANPTGPLSVAHARQAVVGDVLANILSFLGFIVKKEYYLNDEGNQINILAASTGLRMRELQGEKIEFPENYYQGDYIKDIAADMLERGIKIEDAPDYPADYILKIIKQELDDFGVKFDTWFSQKALGAGGRIKETLDSLKKKGLLYEEGGALWFKSTQFGDDKDRVVIKSDGSYTYLAPDIAYHGDKYKRGFGWLINLWGPDHHGYINRLKASVQALGHDAKSLSIIIVQLATIFRNGVPVQMSTRRGQYITLREVLTEVGPDAARFFFVMRRTASHLDFDLEVAKKQTSENPVYYVQYAHARICSILRNNPAGAETAGADLSLLNEKEEIELIKKLWQLPHILNMCLVTEDPYMLTVYLQEAAEYFHKFYDLHRVLGEDVKLTQARLALCQATRIVIAAGLNLLGIAQPEKM